MRLLSAVVVGFLLALAGAPPAAAAPAAPPLDIVHSEVVPLGDSTLTASFTDWPLRARRSLDFTFEPAGGIDGRTVRFRAVAPSGKVVPLGISGLLADRPDDLELPRHPRARHAWGLDVVALREEGTWRFELTVRGSGGTRKAVLPLVVSAAPGPPMALSWAVGLLPWIVLVPLGVYGWIRTRPRRRGAAQSWSG
ncbi:hypothetical protein WEI85_39920 [Actinomycetes bacterium KLBMP 9797]